MDFRCASRAEANTRATNSDRVFDYSPWVSWLAELKRGDKMSSDLQIFDFEDNAVRT